MAERRKSNSENGRSRRPPATTRKGRENELISLAVDLAEKKLRDGTAPAQVIAHYLKLGSTREKLEQERIAQENALMAKKVEQIDSQKRLEDLYVDAIAAMRNYGAGLSPDVGDDDFED